MSDLDAIRARHVVDPAVRDRCLRDVQDWPCDTAIVLAALDAALAEPRVIPTVEKQEFSANIEGYVYDDEGLGGT